MFDSQLLANALVHFPVQRAASLLSNYSSSPVYFYEFVYKGRYSRHVWKDTRKPKGKIILYVKKKTSFNIKQLLLSQFLGGVAHGDDLLYLFDTSYDTVSGLSMPFFDDNDPEILMVVRLTKLWAHFARTGEPLPKGSDLFGNITWEPLRSEGKPYLEMGTNFTIKKDFRGEAMRLWDNLFP